MRRRRQRNPLLMRILVISIVAHLIALPILAHFGAFKKIQQHYVELTAVRLPPPPLEPEKRAPQAKKETPKTQARAKRGPASAPHAHQAMARANVNAPHIAVASGGGGGGTGDFTAEQGTGRVGDIPQSTNTAPAAPVVKQTPPETPPAPTPQPAEPRHQEIAAAVQPRSVPAQPVEPKPAPHQPVFTEAAPAIPAAQEPQPVIPDDLRSEALDKTCVVTCTVSPDGRPTDVKVSQSSGNDELDRLALDAARQWKFKPGTRDGEAVESTVNLHIEFQVS